MTATEIIESVTGMFCIVGVLYLQVIDGLAEETVIAAILVIAGLGGYRVLKEYLDARGGG